MPPIKVNGESNVVMRHGECPRYADVPYAWLDWQCTPALRSFGRSLGYPSLLLTDSRRLERQFSEAISTHQNKVRHVTKESQVMDLAWGISPKFEGLSDCVCFWHLTDVDADAQHVRFQGLHCGPPPGVIKPVASLFQRITARRGTPHGADQFF